MMIDSINITLMDSKAMKDLARRCYRPCLYGLIRQHTSIEMKGLCSMACKERPRETMAGNSENTQG
jgi:hypothetical protein